jgi:hypothetical protein
VVDYYDRAGLLRPVDGTQPIEAVTDELLGQIAGGERAGSAPLADERA